MTEAEWLACSDPAEMWTQTIGKGERKHCLFDAACLRRVWHLLRDERSHQAIEVLERYAEGEALFDELMATNDEADTACQRGTKAENEAAWAVFWATMNPLQNPDTPSVNAANAVAWTVKRLRSEARVGERAVQAVLLRCIFGNPFRPVTVAPEWLAWNGGAIPNLAKLIYDDRHLPQGTLDNARLAVLADALEEAGCTNANILAHCRQPGEHVRGCCVVDLLLGKS
jgi:hypothetical protein